MAANTYYSAHPLDAHTQQHEHLLQPAIGSPGYSPGPSSPLKPLHLVHNMDHQYQGPYSADEIQQVKDLQREDEHLKARIRRLRLVSRILAFGISIAVFVPIALTLHKFLTTQNIYHEVQLPSGLVIQRTAWAKNSKVWPTWMYFLVAGIALLLNLVIVFAYICGGVKHANRAALVTTSFTTFVMVGNVGVWIAAATLYRTEKDKNGKSNDLWGWTCSAGARAIQKEFVKEIDFNQFCNVQSISWYIGLVQAASAVLTLLIWVLVIMRKKSKKRVKRQTMIVTGA